MGPRQWDHVRELFHRVLDVPADRRSAFLKEVCDDLQLRAEVESLLANTEGSGFLDAAAAPGLRDALLAASYAPGRTALGPGDLLKDRYRLEQQLGQGGFGRVFLASDQQLHSRRVVVKALLDENSSDPWFEKRFSQEIRALARIDHPGVVGVLDSGRTDEGTLYLVMQFAEGVTLRSLVEPGGMSFVRVCGLVKQIADGLEAAHEKGIAHHDLKPENIMVQRLASGEERVRLIDFGIARLRAENAEADSVTENTRVAGSPSYMAPEQLSGHPCMQSDIYSLGVVAFELLTGVKPFEAQNLVELYKLQSAGACSKPRVLRPDLSERAESVLLRALAFESADRPESPRAFGNRLAEALGDDLELEPTIPVSAAEYDVFLIHASRDLELAARLVADLEKKKMRCFIAPRDLTVGGLFPATIAAAAKNSRSIVLVLTGNAIASVELAREAEMATRLALPLIALRVDGCLAAGELALFLTDPQWIDVSANLTSQDVDRIERALRGSVPSLSKGAFVPKPHPPVVHDGGEPLFTEFGRIPRFFQPGLRRIRLIALFAVWTLFTCILSAVANTGYITVMLQGPGEPPLPVRFGYLYELNGAFAYLFIVPWFIYFSLGFVLDAQVALMNLASRDQVVINQIRKAAVTPVDLIGEAHRRWMSPRLLAIVFFGTSLIIVGTEYLPPKSDYKHVMFGYVQSPWIAEYQRQCPNCTLLELQRKLGRTIEPLSGRTVAQLSDYRIVEPYYRRTGNVLETSAYVLFMISVLGLQVSFLGFILWTVVNAFFVLQLMYRAVAPSKSSVIGLHLRYTDPGRMFGLESIHRALRQLVAAIAVSSLLPVLAWWTNIVKGSRRPLGQHLDSLGGWGQFLISNGSFVMAVCLLIYLVYIGGKAREAAREESKVLSERPRALKNLDEILSLIAEQSIWRKPRYTVPYLLAPLVCVAAVLMLNRLSIAHITGNLWEVFLRYILGLE